MSHGLQTINDSGVINIDENLKTYVYLGKYPIADGNTTVDIDCAGYPLIYFSLPQFSGSRAGIALVGLYALPGNKWRCTFTVYNPYSETLNLFARVFGRLDYNYPNGSGGQYGMQVWNEQGQLVFDSNLRMHRLAGNTYSTEIELVPNVPTSSESADKYDKVYAMPFSMVNKSIAANGRGMIYYPEYRGSYIDWDTGQTIDQYDVLNFESVYWANGNNIVVGRIHNYGRSFETTGPVVMDYSNLQTVYSRIAVIDNSLFL